MVCRGSPDPPREPYEENFSTSESGNNLIVNASSDSDDEQTHDGYELLSMVSNDIPDSESEQSDTETVEANGIETTVNVPRQELELTSVEPSVSAEVWTAPRGGDTGPCVDIPMGAEQVDQVKAAMASFTLPTSAIPSWAATVPEDQWKQTLMDRLKTLQTVNSSSNTSTKPVGHGGLSRPVVEGSSSNLVVEESLSKTVVEAEARSD